MIGGGPVAQTFLATDSLLTNFGFQFATSAVASTSANVTFSLLSGPGLGGPTLTSSTTSLEGLTFRTGTTFYDVFNGSFVLDAGQTYTALLTTTSSNLSLLFGPSAGQMSDAYTNGSLIKNDAVDTVCGRGVCDANFRFTTMAAPVSPVPETSTWIMILTGFGLVGAGLRYRRRSAKVTYA